MRGQSLFFATRDDLAPGLESIESRWQLEYHPHEMRADKEFRFLASLLDDPTLGISLSGKTMGDPDYFVYPRDRRPRTRSIPQRRGGVRHVLDVSPETIQLCPGGAHADSGALVAGRVARSSSANARGISLYQDFSRLLFAGFHKIRMYSVGPEAYRLFKSGRRLVTIGVRSPPEYDLSDAL
jgi:hypothetical protein